MNNPPNPVAKVVASPGNSATPHMEVDLQVISQTRGTQTQKVSNPQPGKFDNVDTMHAPQEPTQHETVHKDQTSSVQLSAMQNKQRCGGSRPTPLSYTVSIPPLVPSESMPREGSSGNVRDHFLERDPIQELTQ